MSGLPASGVSDTDEALIRDALRRVRDEIDLIVRPMPPETQARYFTGIDGALAALDRVVTQRDEALGENAELSAQLVKEYAIAAELEAARAALREIVAWHEDYSDGDTKVARIARAALAVEGLPGAEQEAGDDRWGGRGSGGKS